MVGMNAARMFQTRSGVRLLATVVLGLGLIAPQVSLAQKPHAAPTPKRGGSITIRQSQPGCLDPYKTSSWVFEVAFPVLDTLLTQNDKGKPVPYLAQSYKVS